MDNLNELILMATASPWLPLVMFAIAMLDGFLTAIASGPTRLPPERWMPWVWDFERGKPRFALPPRRGSQLRSLHHHYR